MCVCVCVCEGERGFFGGNVGLWTVFVNNCSFVQVIRARIRTGT